MIIKTACFILTVLILSCGFTTDRKVDDLKTKVRGEWIVTVPDAPYGYQDFTIHVKEKDNALVADIKGNGVDLKDQKLTEKDGKLTTQIFVEEYITVVIRMDNGLIKATAETSMGNLNCNFARPSDDT
jgi:hypothetical protein